MQNVYVNANSIDAKARRIMNKYSKYYNFFALLDYNDEEPYDINVVYKSNLKYCNGIKIICGDKSQQYINKEVLFVSNWEQIDEILSFYLKYDYETLEIKRR